MAFDGNLFRQVDSFYGDCGIEAAALRQDPHAAAYIDTFANRHSGDSSVVEQEPDESLAEQVEALQRKDSGLFRRVSAFIAIQYTTQ